MSEVSSQKSSRPHLKGIKVSTETHARLEEIAKANKCTYGKEASIPNLLNQISDGRLQVSKLKNVYTSSDSVVELEIDVIIDCNGVMKEISEKILKYKGNIHKAEAKQYNLKSSVNIALTIPSKTNLPQLARDLRKITFENVIKYNTEQQISQAHRMLDLANLYRYEKQNASNQYQPISVMDFKKSSIITDIVCTFGIEIIAQNKPGVLNLICSLLAERYVSIRSIKVDAISEISGRIEVLLGLTLEALESPNGIESIKKFILDLRHHDSIESVEHI